MLQPRSILQLVLIGFAIVIAPLLIAFIVTALFVSELSHTGQQAIVRAADATEASRVLVEEAAAMERVGSQYLVLDDPSVLEMYLQRRSDLWRAVTELRRLGLTNAQRRLLAELEKKDRALRTRLYKHAQEKSATIDVSDFSVLTSLARRVLGESGQLITTNIHALNDNAERVHRLLLWESIALVPLVLVLAGVFVVLINRPLRTLNVAIHNLGAGRLDNKVCVRGPRDLQGLGEALEWTRRRLKELESQKALFFRNMSHELKTPLTTLREGAQLLDDQVVGTLNQEQQEIVALLNENSRQLQRMIEDLLHFSFSDTTVLALDGRPVALDEVVKQILVEQRLILQAKSLSVDLDLAAVSVCGDRTKIKAIIGNLVSNAIKFAPPGSALSVGLSRDRSWSVIDVSDAGPGIAAQDQDRVFEAFYQGRVEGPGHVRGTGLGLFIAREFVRLHEGTIDVLDTKQGAHLRVRLPLAATNAQACHARADCDGLGSDSRVDSGLLGATAGAASHAPVTNDAQGHGR